MAAVVALTNNRDRIKVGNLQMLDLGIPHLNIHNNVLLLMSHTLLYRLACGFNLWGWGDSGGIGHFEPFSSLC